MDALLFSLFREASRNKGPEKTNRRLHFAKTTKCEAAADHCRHKNAYYGSEIGDTFTFQCVF
jgi:hypothetical protein